jgi:glycosyltransferase involved in cell wall biosynthesis
MSKRVSIIIPCFNTSRWLSEAIESSLQQTYSNIEIIVIDDGSTDNSLEIIKSYDNQIIWRSIPHNGGNYARNLALELASGEYIQFLDADDYILPEKIERQVNFLESTGADVVYGDWRHKFHLADGTSLLGEIEISHKQTDILESLLGIWWVALAAILYRRTAIDNSDGWDENLPIAQDRDFFISVVMNGAKVEYQPGCYSIYRHYGNVTVSTSSKSDWIASHCVVMEKAEKKLLAVQKLSNNYKRALAACYFALARDALFIDYSQYLELLEAALTRYPNFEGNSKNPIYNKIRRVLGFRRTEKIVCFILIFKNNINPIFNIFVNPKGRLTTIL